MDLSITIREMNMHHEPPQSLDRRRRLVASARCELISPSFMVRSPGEAAGDAGSGCGATPALGDGVEGGVRSMRPSRLEMAGADSSPRLRRGSMGRWMVSGRPAGARLNLDPAVVLLDDAVTDAQAQSGSLTHRLGREERVEDTVAVRRVDPVAVVLISMRIPMASGSVSVCTVTTPVSAAQASMALVSRLMMT